MALRRRLERKTRVAIFVAVALLVASPILALHNCVSSALKGNQVVATAHPMDDGLLRLKNGATVFLHHSSLSRKIAAWLDLGSSDRSAFEIRATNFVPRSAEPTPEGRIHITQVAQILNADPDLRAEIAFTTAQSTDASIKQLEQLRASRIHRELVVQHVPASKLTWGPNSDADRVTSDLPRQPHLVLILSK